MILNLITQIIFYVFSVSALASALMVVTSKNPVKGVLSLVLCFVAMAGIWILLHAEFLALILVVVYVGAVMTLFLFVVMTLNIDRVVMRRSFVRYFPIGLLIVILIMIMLFYVIGPAHLGLMEVAAPRAASAHYSNVTVLGLTLYRCYLYPFEIAGVLLLVAMVSAITLAFRGYRHRRVNHPDKQIAVQRNERIRLVTMPTEKKGEVE